MTNRDDILDERIRSAVPDEDDSDWRDVRRRAGKKQAPTVLAVGVMIVIFLTAPAYALRQQIADLWSSAEPERNAYVRAFADCGEGSFTVVFDPNRGAVARQGEDVLARASLSDRAIECDAPVQLLKHEPADHWRGDLDGGPSYEATTVSCRTGVALQVVVNPIWDENGKIVGSTLLVAERATRQMIASAVFKRGAPEGRNWSRAYWSSAACSAE